MQSAIHEGDEYQDYFTVSIILQLMLKQTDAEITIDRKNFKSNDVRYLLIAIYYHYIKMSFEV